jgi:hypothetical protein
LRARYADVPAPVRFENSVQQKLQAAQHWRVIADHFARNIAEPAPERQQSRPVCGNPGGEQAFVEGFRELLITAWLPRACLSAPTPVTH